MKEIIGGILISIPFICLFIACLYTDGIKCAVYVFGLTCIVVFLIGIGVYLLTGGL